MEHESSLPYSQELVTVLCRESQLRTLFLKINFNIIFTSKVLYIFLINYQIIFGEEYKL